MQLFQSHPNDTAKSLMVRERYRTLGLLGNGRFADVFSCFDRALNRIVALKQLRPDFRDDVTIVKAFINETKLLSYLEHPGIVALYDSFIGEEKTPCYTMKLVKGNNLRRDYGTKTRGQLLGIFTKLCETMASVHDRGVIHLDLNPENIMLGSYGEVMITDWGNARLFNEKPYTEYLTLVRDAPPPPTDTQQQQCKTTFSRYYAPEQLTEERESLTPSSDIFSMGVLLFEMMTGKMPFSAATPAELTHQICTQVIPALQACCPEIPSTLSGICSKMVEKDPFLRYHSFHEVLIDIDHFQNSGQAFSKRKLKAGEILFNEGDLGDYAFMILDGNVEVSRTIKGKKRVLAHLGREEIAGELAIFTHQPRSATIIALKECTISLLTRASVEQELQKLSPWVQRMVSGLSERFIKLNDYLVQ